MDREDGFSAGASIKLDAEAVGQYIEFPIDVPAGAFEVGLRYKSFPGRGIYQLSIDGVNQGNPVDMHAAQGEYGKTASFGAKTFATGGVKKFRFTVVGKNAASASCSGHFDKLVLAGAKELAYELETLKPTTGGGSDAPSIAEAVAAARNADVAILFVGTNAQVEHEGNDRKSLGLSGRQEELVKAVFAANPRTIVVQLSAGPLTVPWLKQNISAMLQAWWPGEEGGHAIADILFGDINPAGRLPHTVYASEAQVPPQDEYDISKGFTYMYVKGEPLFPFGHGLSYTTFRYSNLRLSTERISPADTLTVSMDLENTGPRPGDEVVQLYTRAISPSIPRPSAELRGFARVALKPGEKKALTFSLPAAKLAFYDEARQAFTVEYGAYEIMVGGSSADIRERMQVIVEAPAR